MFFNGKWHTLEFLLIFIVTIDLPSKIRKFVSDVCVYIYVCFMFAKCLVLQIDLTEG